MSDFTPEEHERALASPVVQRTGAGFKVTMTIGDRQVRLHFVNFNQTMHFAHMLVDAAEGRWPDEMAALNAEVES